MKAPGVTKAEVSFAARSAKVTLGNPEKDLASALDAILTAGYEPAANAQQILARRGAVEAAKADVERQRRDGARAILALALFVFLNLEKRR